MHLIHSNFNNYKIFRKLILSTFLIIITSFSLKLNAQQTAQRDENGKGYLEYLPAEYNDNTDLYPVIIFLHGQGERGNGSPADLERVKKHGPPKHIKNGHNMCFENNGVEECFIVLSPQTNGYNFWAPDVMSFIETAKENYRIDPDRVYLMGISMGGQGVWRTAYSEENENNIFAALSVAPGKGSFDEACKVAENKTPVWAFHGTNDNSSMPIHAGRRPIEGMIACDANPAPIFTEYEGVGHNSWERAYRTDNSVHTPNIYQWFLAQSKSGSGNNNNVPSAPNNLSDNFAGTHNIKLSWNDNSNNETNFLIERSLSSNSNFNVIKTTSNNITTYEDQNLNPNTQYFYRVRAENNEGFSSYSNKLSVKTDEDLPNEPNVTSIIIDNDSDNVQLNGSWQLSYAGGGHKYGNNYLHDNNSDIDKEIIFQTQVTSGEYEVFAWWFAHDNRSSKTPFKIESINGTETILQNQKNNNGKWVSLGVYTFSNTAKITISNTNTDGYVVADAIKLQPREINEAPEPPAITEIIIDNKDANVNTLNDWEISQAGGSSKHDVNYLHDNNSLKGEKEVTFTAEVSSGNYEVYAKWFAFNNRATNTPFEINTSSGAEIVYKNQQINDGVWVLLGEFEFNNTAEITVKNNNTDGYVVADAIKLVSSSNNLRQENNSELIEKVTLEDISVFPNPVKNNFNIRSPFAEEKEFHLKMRSKTGHLEWEQSLRGVGELKFEINRTYISSGIKFLSIEVEGEPIKLLQILLL